MCTQQGAIKHTKACRRIVLLQDYIQVRNFVVDIRLFTVSNHSLVNLNLILRFLSEKGASMRGYEFEFLDQKVTIRSLEQNVYLGIQSFMEHVITINRKPISYYPVYQYPQFQGFQQYQGYEVKMEQKEMEVETQMMGEKGQEINQYENHYDKQSSLQKEQIRQTPGNLGATKKQKDKERQIRNTIECVKLWRGIYDVSGHKTSLINAAQLMGISKKSLDDYFLQLRLGELYGFDFGGNLERGIGVLRAFVKENYKKDAEGKLPKEIKCYGMVRGFEELRGILLQERSGFQGRDMDGFKVQLM